MNWIFEKKSVNEIPDHEINSFEIYKLYVLLYAYVCEEIIIIKKIEEIVLYKARKEQNNLKLKGLYF